MTPTRSPFHRPPALATSLIFGLILSLTACQSTVTHHGDGSVPGVYSLGTLKAELSTDYRVPAVVVAAAQSLSAQGYTITTRESTDQMGRLVAKAPGDARLESMEINIRASAKGTKIAISRNPFGDEIESRVLLDAILYRLGF